MFYYMSSFISAAQEGGVGVCVFWVRDRGGGGAVVVAVFWFRIANGPIELWCGLADSSLT